MVNGRMPLYLTLLAAVLCAAALWVLQPYTVRSPWDAYTRPAQQFLRAAIRRDSLALTRQSGSVTPVVWALAAARTQPESLKVWARDAEAWTGKRRGDTADVLLSTATAVCSRHPIWLRFVGSGEQARVVRASSACFGPR
ncbi:MAG TPA: hypothetical protein VHR41_01735 [Gemmatimonadales bacterium]|jgi:hypothetical protein|nr:hypothetical protein [Gemmatimonadales bacterium]